MAIDRDRAADRRMADTPSLMVYLPRILLYPLTGFGLGALAMLTFMLWLGTQSILGIGLLAIASPWVFHYAEAVIVDSMNGRATPPRFGGDMLFLGSNARAFRPLIGVVLIVAAWLYSRDLGKGAEILTLGVGAFLFPAFMLVLTGRNSLLSALNPLQLVMTMVGVGVSYVPVCLLLTASAAAIVLAAGQAMEFGTVLASIYLWLMSFHLLGYVAFHRHKQLGLRLKSPPPTEESRRMEEQNERLAAVVRNIDVGLHAGDLTSALRSLHAEPGGPADLQLFHEELFEQMQQRRKASLVHDQGRRLIAVLIQKKRTRRALDVAETCFDTHSEFTLHPAAHAVTLATAALATKRDGLFLRLAKDARKRYGDDPTSATLEFLSAQFHIDRHNDEARARELLSPLLSDTGHPRYRQIAAYAKALGLEK